MQIHELTQKHPVSEGVVGALASSVASQIGQKFVQSQTGTGPNQFAGQRVAAGQRPATGLAMNTPALQLMAKKAQEAWVLTQQELAKKSVPPVASAAELNANELKPHLTGLINQLVGFDYTKQPAANPASPEVALGMKSARDFIDREIDEILRLTKEKPEQTKVPLAAAWTELVQKGIGPLQTYSQSAAGAASGSTVARAQMKPDAAALSRSIGQSGTQALAQHLQGKQIPRTGISAIDGLFTQLGAILK